MSDGEPIQCRNCGHNWNTTSTMKMVTCPSCMRKTENPRFHRKDDE